METKKVAYIAGAVRGLDPVMVAAKFEAKQKELEAQGYHVYNPVKEMKTINATRIGLGMHELKDDDTEDRKKIIGFGIGLMAAADELHLLHDWQESEGATKELTVAKLIPMTIIYP